MHPPKVHIPAGKAEAVALNSGTGVPSTGLPGMGHSLELVGEAKPTQTMAQCTSDLLSTN